MKYIILYVFVPACRNLTFSKHFVPSCQSRCVSVHLVEIWYTEVLPNKELIRWQILFWKLNFHEFFLFGFRFDGGDFLRRFRGKQIMFVGDSLSLNQWQSLTCMLHTSVPHGSYTLVRTGDLSTFTFQVSYTLLHTPCPSYAECSTTRM